MKAFHIFFIAISTICTLGFATWAADDYAQSGNTVNLGLAVGAFAVGALLIWYATWFLKKLKHVGYLVVLLVASAGAAQACAVCNGAADAQISQGAKAGVVVLGGVVATMLAAIASVAAFWARRARALDAAEAGRETPLV